MNNQGPPGEGCALGGVCESARVRRERICSVYAVYGMCVRARALSLCLSVCSLCDTCVRAGCGRFNVSLKDGPSAAAPFKEASAPISSLTTN